MRSKAYLFSRPPLYICQYVLRGILGSGSLLCPLLRVQDGLQLWGCFETSMVRMLLIEVIIGLRLQLGGQLFENSLYNAIDRSLFRSIAVPNRDEVRVEAYRKTYAANLVPCSLMLVSSFLPKRHMKDDGAHE